MANQRIAELRREIEAITELNDLYRAKRYHRNQWDETAHNRRIVRLEEIKQELKALSKKN